MFPKFLGYEKTQKIIKTEGNRKLILMTVLEFVFEITIGSSPNQPEVPSGVGC